MGGWLHRWVLEDFWAPVWPNIAATVLMSTWILRRVRRHLHRHHAEIRDHIDRRLRER